VYVPLQYEQDGRRRDIYEEIRGTLRTVVLEYRDWRTLHEIPQPPKLIRAAATPWASRPGEPVPARP
jgi:hypothetical protein